VRSRRDRVVTAAIGALGVLMVAHAVCSGLAEWALRRTLDEQRRQGLPMTLGEALSVPPADSTNAALPLVHAFTLMGKGRETGNDPYAAIQAILVSRTGRGREAGNGTSTIRSVALTPSDVLARAETPGLAQVFRLLESAAEMPACQFRWNDTNGTVRLPHVPHVAQAVGLLNARAMAYAATGHPDRALDDLRRSLCIADHLRNDPFLISQLVAASCQLAAIGDLQRVLNATPPRGIEEGRLRALTATLNGLLDPTNRRLIRALDGERIVYGGRFLSAIRAHRLAEEGLEGRPRSWRFRLYASFLGRPLQKWDLRRYVILMAGNREWAGQSFSAAQEGNRSASGRARLGFSDRLSPALDGVQEAVARREAGVEVARVGLAAALHWQTHQRYPNTLADLSMAGPASRDPFGDVLVYRPAPDRASYLVYSVGPNQRDDGGTPRDRANKIADLTWEIGRSSEGGRAPR
jgi:hypothetical protein